MSKFNETSQLRSILLITDSYF